MQTKLFLIRHGLTAANREDRFAGRTDEPLLDLGIEQLASVAGQLQNRGIAAVYCGPLTRTIQSARVLATLLDLPMEVVNDLNEILLPHWDGLNKDEIRRRFGAQYPTWLATPEQFRVPDCETIGEVQRRAVGAVAHLAAKHPGGALLIVSHLIVLRSLVLHFRQLPLADFRTVKISNGQVIELAWKPGGEVAAGLS